MCDSQPRPQPVASRMWSVLTPEGLNNIASHKYKPGQYSPMETMLNPLWVHLTEYLPRRLAPNLVTLAGLFPLLLTNALIWWISPDFATPAPSWVCVLAAFSMLFYQTMDSLDGKQARRIDASSPLGQLFDHGCDCLGCISMHSMAALACLPGATHTALGCLACLQSGFFMAQWQEHYTGVLYTCFGPFGVIESQFGLICITLLAGLAGPESVTSFSHSKSSLSWPGMEPPSKGLVVQIGWLSFCLFMIVICFSNTIVKAYRGIGMPSEQAHHIPPAGLQRVCRAVLDLLPIASLNCLWFCWPTAAMRSFPRLIVFSSGLLFFFCTAQMILFTMARLPFPVCQPALLPYAGLILASWLLPLDKGHMEFALMAFALGLAIYVLLWLWVVIAELKERLSIYCFSVASPILEKKV